MLTNLRRPQTLPCDGVAALAVSTRTLVLCGDALQVWEGRGRLQRTGRLDARRRPAEVAVDLAPDGRAVATWATRTRGVPAAYRVVVAERAPGGAFGPPEFITEQYASVVPVAAELTTGGGAVCDLETFGQGGRSMLAVRLAG